MLDKKIAAFVVCNRCGRKSPPVITDEEHVQEHIKKLRRELKARGWVLLKDGDYCPTNRCSNAPQA